MTEVHNIENFRCLEEGDYCGLVFKRDEVEEEKTTSTTTEESISIRLPPIRPFPPRQCGCGLECRNFTCTRTDFIEIIDHKCICFNS